MVTLITACNNSGTDSLDATMNQAADWMHGRYNNATQVDQDRAAELPDNEAHRLMHQVFFPVSVPALAGRIIYQQSSIDGSEDPDLIARLGLVQLLVDRDADTVRYRELNFHDPEKFKNAHRNPQILSGLTAADLTWDTGCDFHLQRTASERIEGPIPEGSCRIVMGQELIADDHIVITPREFSFRGKYVNAQGRVMWGTESEELNRLVRISD
jgi:hypothetical protein